MATTERRTADIDRARLKELTERERAQFLERTQGSQAKFDRAVQVMPKGVPSSFQAGEPRPIYLPMARARASGTSTATSTSTSTTASASCASPRATRRSCKAVSERAAAGSHFAAPTDGSIVVAEELRRRFGLPQWRFTNSGTESTMDAIHLARGATGRDLVLKIEGSYHGHHDSVMVSVRPPLEQLGPRGEPGAAVRRRQARRDPELTKAIPFNDADALERALDDRRVAAVILEPAMMNITIVCPRAGLPRSACASCATRTARS